MVSRTPQTGCRPGVNGFILKLVFLIIHFVFQSTFIMRSQLISSLLLCGFMWWFTRGNQLVGEGWQVIAVGQKPMRAELYLWWNLGLAMIPWWLALFWSRYLSNSSWILQGVVALIWLVFLPNGPYLLTDLVHWRGAGHWGDWLLFLVFAWTGLQFTLVSVRLVENVISSYFSRSVLWFLRAVVFSMVGFGVFLGRIFRWNTWDLYFDPWGILADIERAVLPGQAMSWILPLSFLFGAFLLSVYSFHFSPSPKSNSK
jgi:uncharacterized membrane protein